MKEAIKNNPKKVVLKLFELLENRDQTFSKLFTENAIFHTTWERKLKIEGLMENFIADLSAFPDYHYQINRVIAEEKIVVVDYNWTGTQEKEYWEIPSKGN
jgi:predicted ester cyclase